MSNILRRIETPGLCWHQRLKWELVFDYLIERHASFHSEFWWSQRSLPRDADNLRQVPYLQVQWYLQGLPSTGKDKVTKQVLYKLPLRKLAKHHMHITEWCQRSIWQLPGTWIFEESWHHKTSSQHEDKRNTVNIIRLPQRDSKKQKFSNRSPEATLSVSDRSSSVLSKPVVWRLPMRLLLPCKA